MDLPDTERAADDARLLARISSGDAGALAALYDRHAGVLYSFAASLCRDERDAEEPVADAFQQIWRTASDFDVGRGTALAWMVTITRSRALDQRRAAERRAAMRARAEAAGMGATAQGRPPAPDAEVEGWELRERVRGALAMLSEIQREAIELAYFGGLSQSQISERLEVPLGTVKTRIRDGMTRLRTVLDRAPEGRTG